MRYRMSLALPFAAATIGTLAACGGGSDSSEAGTAKQVFPTAVVSAGDYFVYSITRTPILPANPAYTVSQARQFTTVNNDGSAVRYTTYSDSNPHIALTYDTAFAAVSSTTGGTQRCDYSPAYRGAPPRGSAVGSTYSTPVSTLTCATSAGATPTVSSLSASGSNLSVETVSIPLGSFTAFKYRATYTTLPSGSSTQYDSDETCWVDMTFGQVVKCTLVSTSKTVGTSTILTQTQSEMVLSAYSIGGAARGQTTQRFAGSWQLNITGSYQFSCPSVLISMSGQLSGSCSDGAVNTFGISGSVDSAGTVTAELANGATVVGNLNSPNSGSGSWQVGSSSGTWSASHN